MAKLVDTNLIIRFLLNDNQKQADAAKKLFSSSEKLYLTDLVLAEIVWVLTSVYNFPKVDIAQKLQNLLNLNIFKSNKRLLNQALQLYEQFSISFVDAYLASLVLEKNLEGIYSFDKGLDKIKSLKRLEP